jgi:hypothetical protein
LPEIVEHIKKKHSNLNFNKEGVYGMKFVKRTNGSRVLIEDISGFRVFSYSVYNDSTLIITQFATGMSFKNNTKINMSSRLFLDKLVMINVYDHAAEFFTANSIDFAYAENGHIPAIEFLDEMLSPSTYGNVKAQWVCHDPDVEQMLDEISFGRRIVKSIEMGRGIDLDLESGI